MVLIIFRVDNTILSIDLKIINVKKGETLQSKRDLNSQIYFVQSGLLRSYSIDKKGTFADAIMPSEECELFIDALDYSSVRVHEKDQMLNEIDSTKIRKHIRTLEQRIIMLMSANAIQCYEHFVKTYPVIVQRFPQRMIASYLGITPEALSKVKGTHLKSQYF